MGKDLLRPLQIYLSKLRGSKVYEERCNEEKSSWIFSCKHPRTESLSLARGGESSQSGKDVYSCYNSLYVVSEERSRGLVPVSEKEEEEHCEDGMADKDLIVKRALCMAEDSDNQGLSSKCSSDSSNFFSDSSRSSDLPPGLASGLTSERFFFSPGRSNSILEEAKCKSFGTDGEEDCVNTREKIDLLADNSERWDLVKSSPSCHDFSGAVDAYDLFKSESVAVFLNSPNPYRDFRISMQEMVEAHNFTDWESLQEMLICYLSLNHKRTHSFILGAFADLVASIVNTSSQAQSQVPLLECAD
ncbi:hypothetical protein SUGI_0279050 [Cryptomeria japonica]|uniref:uncharacterized protein LOC131075663 n=1 Tax=Cryptomeria japonica TaxID=3369 RepID=UPI002408EA79|nr:uncharacterized protein LOC131075663 [Cryptomeria japonica]GLJ16425.1 hypothetical protein SUGI_0279050 [Cryptomeria japonica]